MIRVPALVLVVVGVAVLAGAAGVPSTRAHGDDPPRYRDDYVQPYYLYPADQKYYSAYEAAVRKAIQEVHAWFQKKTGVTLRMAPLQVVKAKKTYAEMKFGRARPTGNPGDMPAWLSSVLEAVGGCKDRRVAWVFVQGGGGWAGANLQDDFKGFAIFGDWVLEPISGVENPDGIPARLATWQVKGGVPMGTTVHELGHAFGIHHPDHYPGKSLMRWHGDWPEVAFLPHEVMILKQSPFVTGLPPDPKAPYPSFATMDMAHWGETLVIPGRRFKRGDVVEFVTLRRGQQLITPVKPQKTTATGLEVIVPADLGPGYFRVRRGSHVSHGIPINLYPPKQAPKPKEP